MPNMFLNIQLTSTAPGPFKPFYGGVGGTGKTSWMTRQQMDARLLEFYRDELRSDSLAIRLGALQRTKYLAKILGPFRVVNDILPIFEEIATGQCSDEVYYSLAEQLAIITDYMGPPPDSLTPVLPLLELIAAQEETVVRERAVASVVELVKKSVPSGGASDFIKIHLVNFIENLCSREWFTARVSACHLLAPLYTYADTADRQTFISFLEGFLKAETPMVQRAAAAQLSDVVAVAEVDVIVERLMPLIVKCWKTDTQESMRISGLRACIAATERLSPLRSVKLTLPIISSVPEESSWKLRRCLAERFDKLVESLGPYRMEVLQCFKALLKDPIQDIRIVSLTTLRRFCRCLTPQQLRTLHLQETFAELAGEPAQAVRTATADVILLLAEVSGKRCDTVSSKKSGDKMFLDIILQLMRDECCTVQLSIVRHGATLCSLFGLEVISDSLVHTLTTLLENPQRRIRLETVNQLPQLAKQFGPAAFKSSLEPLFLSAFDDSVHSVRQAAINNAEHLGKAFGKTWTATVLLPQLLKKYDGTEGTKKQGSVPASPTLTSPYDSSSTFSLHNSHDGPDCASSTPCVKRLRSNTNSRSDGISYLTRITVVQAMPKLMNVLTHHDIGETVLPLIVRSLQDPVPNVRIAAARVSLSIAESLGTTPSTPSLAPCPTTTTSLTRELSKLKTHLETLISEDNDVDVAYFAHKALKVLS